MPENTVRAPDEKCCPECGYEFRSGWRGFHKHWWSKHDWIMSAEDARQAAKDNNYLDVRNLTIQKPTRP